VTNPSYSFEPFILSFVFSHSGNFRAKANPPKPRSCPKCPYGQWLGPTSSAGRVHSSVLSFHSFITRIYIASL